MNRAAFLAALALAWLVAPPALAQNHTCPTAAAGDNSNKCASTAFVQQGLSTLLALPQNEIFIGNASNVATPAPISSLYGTQSANRIFAGPSSGAASNPGFRALVGADLPPPSASTLGGVESITSLAHNWIAFIDTAGLPHQSQPDLSDLTGTLLASQEPAHIGDCTNTAGNLTLTCLKTNGVPFTATATAAAGQIPGEPSNGSASAGNVGQYVESVIASGS